jgi:hypothetical protein
LAYEIVEHDFSEVSDPDTLSKIILKKLEQLRDNKWV